jgi:hypothetical protein
MSDAQCESVRRFAARGGAVIATGLTSLFNEFGDSRKDFGLADIFGAHLTAQTAIAAQTLHTYLRLSPELRAAVPGPNAGDEPRITGQRHPALKGFEQTDILPFGGTLTALRLDPGVTVPMTFVPPFPVLPPETSWMREPATNIPGLVLKDRVAFMPADIDRQYARNNLPDHAQLLANLVRWAAGGDIPLQLEGRGLFDCNLYTQPGRVIAHLVNLTDTGRMPITDDDMVPSGPLKFALKLPAGVKARTVKMLVAGRTLVPLIANGWARIAIPSILDHEVLLIE